MEKKIHYGHAQGVFAYDRLSSVMFNLGTVTISFAEFFGGKEIVYQCKNDVVVKYQESPSQIEEPLSIVSLYNQSPDAEYRIGEVERILFGVQEGKK